METAAAILVQALIQQRKALHNEIENVKAGEDTPEYFARLFEPHYRAMLAMVKSAGTREGSSHGHLSTGPRKTTR